MPIFVQVSVHNKGSQQSSGVEFYWDTGWRFPAFSLQISFFGDSDCVFGGPEVDFDFLMNQTRTVDLYKWGLGRGGGSLLCGLIDGEPTGTVLCE